MVISIFFRVKTQRLIHGANLIRELLSWP